MAVLLRKTAIENFIFPVFAQQKQEIKNQAD
jgi:hypothetical protein